MIEFKNASFLKLRNVSAGTYSYLISPMLIEGEKVIGEFQSIRDGVIFTNKRIISINVQGITGKKKNFTSLPYSKIQLFSVETSGVFDLDSELDLWFAGEGKVHFEFTGNTNISYICKIISTFVLV